MILGRRQQANGESKRSVNKSASKLGVYSYYKTSPSQKSTVQPEKSVDFEGIGKKARLLPGIIAVAVIVASLLISLTVNSVPNVETLQDRPSPYRSLDEYAEATAAIIDKSLGNKTKLTIQPDNIESQLINQYPELKAAVLRLPVLGRKPTLILDIRQPELLLTTSTSSFILDESGLAVSESRNLSAHDRNGLPVLRDQSGLDISVGKQAVTTGTVEFINGVLTQLDAKGLKVAQLILPVSANELDISIEGLDYIVKTDTAGDARLQIGSFLAVKEKLEGEGVSPSEYVDVRVNEKVFYK